MQNQPFLTINNIPIYVQVSSENYQNNENGTQFYTTCASNLILINCAVRILFNIVLECVSKINSGVLSVSSPQFYITSWNDKTKSRMEQIGDYKGWDVSFHIY